MVASQRCANYYSPLFQYLLLSSELFFRVSPIFVGQKVFVGRKGGDEMGGPIIIWPADVCDGYPGCFWSEDPYGTCFSYGGFYCRDAYPGIYCCF